LRRILTVLTAAALMAAWLVVLQGPAMAQTFRFDDNDDNDIFDNNDIFDDNGFFFDNNRDNDIFDNNGFFGGFGGFEQETGETGDVNNTLRVANTGNNSNQCVAPTQFGNTGNLQNAQGFSSFGSPSRNGFDNDIFDNNGFFNGFDGNIDDVEFEAPEFTFNPEQSVNCNQAVEQSAAASG
jgi:hypothetical protein